MQRVRIGIRVPQYGSTWAELRDAACHIERLGFDGIWVNDHLQSPGRNKREPTFDALTTLAALAPITERARLGVAVLSSSYRPAALAGKMTTVLDVISGGRLVVGLGTGSDRPEHAAYGYPFGTPGERTAGLVAALDTMRAMATAPDGPMPNQPPAVQRPGPPIWLAAHKPRLLRLAGERADGVVAAFLPPGELTARRAVAEEARQAAGRPPIAYCLYTFAFAYPTEREALGWLAREAGALDTTAAGLLRWLRTTGIVGTEAEVRDRLAEYADAGASDAVLALPSRVPLEATDALARSLLAGDTPARPERPPAARDGERANLVDLLVERHRRAGRGGDAAVIDDSGTWTFDELADASARGPAACATRARDVATGWPWWCPTGGRGARRSSAPPDSGPWRSRLRRPAATRPPRWPTSTPAWWSARTTRRFRTAPCA